MRLLLCCGVLLAAMCSVVLAEDSAGSPDPFRTQPPPEPTASEPATPAAEQVLPAQRFERVAYILIDGPIDRHRHRYFINRIEQARAAEVDAVVVHINTDGGRVDFAREMLLAAVQQKTDGPHMIAYVDFRAISAGAMIAYGHAEVHLAEAASIGDIGVIFQTSEGIEYAPEKIETVVRTLLATAAEQRGWDRAQILKMTARNQILYRVDMPDGSHQYVIGDALPTFLADNPDIDRETDVHVDLPEDRLLTMTGLEALSRGMATSNQPTLEALYAHLGIDQASVIDLSPSQEETVAWFLGSFSPLLAGLTLLFIFFELKTPGVGVWALLGAICGGAFLITNYFLDMVTALDLVLVVVGFALIAVELFFAVTGGILAVGGGIALLAGLLLMFLPNEIDPTQLTDERVLEALGSAGVDLLLTVAVAAVGFVAFIATAQRSPFVRRVAMAATIEGTSAGDVEAHADSLIGHDGVLRAECHPSGVVVIDGREHSARSQHGSFIATGTAVRVVSIQFGELIVVACPPAEAAEEGTA